MRKWLACLVVFLLVLGAALGFIYYLGVVYLPNQAEEQLAAVIQTKLKLEETPTVRVKSSLFELLSGKIREIDILIPKLVSGNVAIEKVQVEVKNIDLDLGKLDQEKKIELKEPFDLFAAFYLPEKEVESQLHQSMVVPFNWPVRLEPNKVLVEASVEPVKGQVLPVVVAGSLELENDSIRFIPSEIKGVNPLFASAIKILIFPELEKNIPLQNLPRGVKIVKIKILKGRLSAEVEAKDIVLPEEIMDR